MNIFELDPEYDGACPCLQAYIDELNVQVYVHCWRSASECGCDCKYSGIHIHVPRTVTSDIVLCAEEILAQFKKVWSNTDWELHFHENFLHR
jgi:hypothetical protein